ncbi:YceI family protein [Agromyces aerolatus]|uniref:YceI family protein n=1 Tax=Agromyces sp. LY-1074 TaxID=3074080 RepID=UPI002864F967|nr:MULTISPECIES: YceI family protein [unclassified Agromyces]MDR5701098.1 YceI family protein [Agromyces sp. LY-1074]MDR5707738.1 YceI family protein [Agromyces sp. LY-1358]
MQKRTKIIVASIVAGVVVLGATAAIAGPVIYRDVIVGEAEAAPSVTAAPSAEADAGSGAGADDSAEDLSGTWSVGAGSYAGYRVDEVLNGTDVTVVGRTEQVTGTLQVEELSLTAAELTVDVATIETDSGNRDDYFRDTALRVDEHPTATFVLTEAITTDEAPVVGEVQTVQATGDLTLAGVTQTVTVELEAVLNGETGQVAGSIPITFADFGVEAPNLGFVSVEPTGFIEFSLELQRA